ncbi:hypothetical protein [Hydrogenophaga sp. MI9]|uniref:hypothetical protein n=1 Tax=Hydrogenophaga sp. MI9 TaxID=3453719 RepID=UPI003EEDD4DF
MNSSVQYPPLPQVLREALKDYPELIDGLQEVISDLEVRPGMSKARRTDLLELAIGSLEDRLDSYLSNTAQELREAEATGDVALIEKAREKEMLMVGCRGGGLRDSYDELIKFFDQGLN